MKKLLAIAAITSLTLVSCQKNETTDVTASKAGYVSFDPYAGKTTRAALTTNATFSAFTVYAYQGADADTDIDWTNPKNLMTNLTVTKVPENKWNTESPIKWPAKGTKTQFFAYSPKDAATYSVAESKPQLAFTAATVVADQKDLVIAKSAIADAPVATVAKAVDLNFSHALSKVSTKVNTSQSIKVYIQSIEMCNLGSKATYSFDPAGGNSWGATTSPANYSVTLSPAAESGIASGTMVDITAANGAALVIPQATTAWADKDTDGAFTTTTKSYIKISYKMQNTVDDSYIVGDADTYITAYFPVTFNFTANKAYNFNITFGDTSSSTGGGGFDDNGDPIITLSSLISFTVSFTDWDTKIDDNDVKL